MAHMCPHCGFNLTPDEPITSGPWFLRPDTTLLRGEPLAITPQQSAVLYTLAKARGEFVSPEIIKNRVSDSESGDNNIVYVLLARLRKRLPVVPFTKAYGRGFRWTGGEM